MAMEEMLMKEKESEHQHRRSIVVPTLLPSKALLMTPFCKLSSAIIN